ncbi:hypothetical protein IJG78_01025 [Candidatus Saccharibacteria bacterium]|nr:hypothetical protein [Candidatus Saccharibacteria bacterium]
MIPERYKRRNGQEFSEWLFHMLFLAYLDARKGKRKTEDEKKFEENAVENLLRLRDDILERKYEPSAGIAFTVHDPVLREIFAAPFRDRVVHHFIYNMVAEWWDKRLIYDSYSCRVGKGVLKGIQRLRKQENSAIREFKEPVYIVKMDIQGYFMSLPRKNLYEQAVEGLKQQFGNSRVETNGHEKWPREYYVIKYLWRKIIFDDPTKGVKKRGNPKEWLVMPTSKSLFCQPEGIGIVIGNLSSQLLSNIYLDALDRYIKFTLGYKYYGRYVDDFFILVPKSKLEMAMRDVEVIRVFLSGLGLKLHPKKLYVQNINRGTTFLGTRVYPNRILPGPRIVKRYKLAVRKVANGRADISTLVSYMGLVKHFKSTKIQKKIFDSVGWEYNA